MSENDETMTQYFLNRVTGFIDHKNIIKEPSSSRRRDIREVISIINQLIKSESHVENKENQVFHKSSFQALLHIDIALSSLMAMTELKLDGELKIKMLAAMPGIYMLLGDLDKAHEMYKEVLDVSTKLNHFKYQAFSKLKIGEILSDKKEWSLAEPAFNEAKELYNTIKDYKGEMNCWYGLGQLFHRKGQYHQALESYEKALQMAESIAAKRTIAYVKNYLGVIHRILRKNKESEFLLQNALKTFKEINDYVGQLECLNNLSLIFLHRSNYQKSLLYLNESLEIAPKIENYQLMSFINFNKAIFYLEVGDSRNAAKCCTSGLEIACQLENPVGFAKASRIFGTIFRNYGQYDISSRFYEESIRFYQECQIPLGLANCCAEYAEMLIEYEKIDESAKYFEKAINIYEQLDLYEYLEEMKLSLNLSKHSINDNPELKSSFTQWENIKDN